MWDAYFQSENNQIFFGGINGLTCFYPDNIQNEEPDFDVYISKLIIHNKEIKINEKINGHIILTKNIKYSENIKLTYREPVFTLEFLTHDHFNPRENSYAYMLDGFDEDWNYTNSERRYATYTNLNPGIYTFKVKATNGNGIWNENISTLEIIIDPPIWKTWWAYLIYIAVFLLLLYLLQIQILKFARLKHKLEIEQLYHEKDNELFQTQLRFFTNLSHEFRTPLTLILGPVEKILQSNQGGHRIRQQLEIVNKNAKRLLKLTNQLLNFRKLENEKLNLNAAKGNIIKFVNEIAIAFRQHAKMKQISYSCDFQEKKIVLWYDRDKLEIILFNLLSNAFKFTPAKGKINISIRKNNFYSKEAEDSGKGFAKAEFGSLPQKCKEWVEISVKDNGCGIPKENIEKIFRRYYQVDKAEFENVPSSGIGLEQVKNLIEILKGKLSVISAEEVGSNFILYLPTGSDHLNENEILSSFKNSEHTDHYRIPEEIKADPAEDPLRKQENETAEVDKPVALIIDDNPDILIFLKEILKTEYRVLEASEGKKGYDIALKEIPDIILSDVMMPNLDGLELCARLKSDVHTSHIPVILLTARSSLVYKVEGFETGADDYITKPFDVQTLKARMRNLIVSRKRLSQKFREEYLLRPRDTIIKTPDEKFLEHIIRIIEENISDPDFNVEKLAHYIGMSHSLIYKKLKALTDQNIVEFIRTIKLKRAAQILARTKISVSEVSTEVGFNDPKYFSKCFQKQFDKTPTEYASQYHS
jgi:signal transduction histidine kinase/AraC-like DNA-binding protein